MAVSRLNFTEARIRDLQPQEKTYCVYDAETPGLGVRVSPKGKKTFIWYRSHKNKPERETIGDHPDLSVRDARASADALNGRRAKGESVTTSRQTARAELTLGELHDEYIEQYASSRCTTWEEMRRSFRQCFAPWLNRKLSDISRLDVQKRINELAEGGRHHKANRAHDDIRAVFSWGIKKNRFVGENPAEGVDKFPVQARDRFIQLDEFARFYQAVLELDPLMRDFFLVSLFTGQRKTDVMEMRWEYVNFEHRTWFIPKTKNGDSLTVPLTEAAVRVLSARCGENKPEEGWVFPGTGITGHLVEPKLAWRKVLKRAGIANLRIHDLRRSMGSYMAILNTNASLTARALGHKSLAAAARYQRVNSNPAGAAMNDAVNVMLAAMGALDETDNVVPLKKAQ